MSFSSLLLRKQHYRIISFSVTLLKECNLSLGRPQGVEGWKRNPKKEEQYSTSGISVRQAGGREEFDLRAGLLADLNNEVDALGDPVGGDDVDNFLLRSYINTACLPERLEQFPAGTRCWVAAWGTGLKEQREVGSAFIDSSSSSCFFPDQPAPDGGPRVREEPEA